MNERDFLHNYEVNENPILLESYQHINKQLLDKKSSFPKVRQASKMASQLRENHWQRMDEIQHHVFLKFLEDKKHESFDPGKASLYTYTGYHTFFEVRDLESKFDKAVGDEIMFRYCVLDDDLNPHWYADTLPDSVKKNTWKPLLKSQSPLLDGLIEFESPEDILIKKEFWRLALSHYTEIDIMVLLGRMKKTEAAAELNMNYDAYCKSLQRKNKTFRIIVTKAGHC